MSKKKVQPQNNEGEIIYSGLEEFLSRLSDGEKRSLFLGAYNYLLGNNISKYEIDKLKEVFSRFKEGDDDEKKKIIDVVLKSVLNNSSVYLHILNQMICEKEGHKFGKWEEYKVKNVEYYDNSLFHTRESAWYGTYSKIETEETKWCRCCSVCGTNEFSQINPKYLTEKEERKKL